MSDDDQPLIISVTSRAPGEKGSLRGRAYRTERSKVKAWRGAVVRYDVVVVARGRREKDYELYGRIAEGTWVIAAALV